ncbi:hypothetical protein FOCC_FOCC010984 [Frankliniella occidentalis]|nr:hypothetical protein FOCC_FOCC010984 [Frankliniella occidentalis]
MTDIVEKRFANQDLHSFTNAHTKEFFKLLHLDASFLDLPLEQWADSQPFQAALKVVESLAVVNGVAERAVKLTTEYNNSKLTLLESRFQNPLLF